MSTEARLTRVVSEQLGLPEADVKPESRFVEDLGADSLDQVELHMAIEDEFGLDIAFDDYDKLHTVQDVIAFLGAHVS